MIILAYSDGKGETADLLKDAAQKKAKELNFKSIIFPETGVHPQFQSEIMDDLFKKGEDVVVATHSELLMLRAMRRMETKEVTSEDFKIEQYLKPRNNPDRDNFWSEVSCDEDGLNDPFIGGYFEQGYEERFNLIKLKPL